MSEPTLAVQILNALGVEDAGNYTSAVIEIKGTLPPVITLTRWVLDKPKAELITTRFELTEIK